MLEELAEVASGVTGTGGEIAHTPARKGELPRSALDAGRAQRDLGWQPERSLVEGRAQRLRMGGGRGAAALAARRAPRRLLTSGLPP